MHLWWHLYIKINVSFPLDCEIFDWTVGLLCVFYTQTSPPNINNPMSLQYPFTDFVFQRLIRHLWHWTYLLGAWTPHLWSERAGLNKVSQRSFLGLKLQAIQMVHYFAKKVITVPAPATISSTWHERRLFKNTYIVLVCSYSMWRHLPSGSSNEASPEASYMKSRHVNLLIPVHMDTRKCWFQVDWTNISLSREWWYTLVITLE